MPGGKHAHAILTTLLVTRRRACIKILLVLLVGLGVGTMVVGARSWGICYTSPCVVEDGLSTLFSFHSGQSFAVLLQGVMFVAYGGIGLALAFQQEDVPSFASGLFVGAGLGLSVFSLMSFVEWSMDASMTENHQISSVIADSKYNAAANTAYSRLSILTGAYFFLELLLGIILAYGGSQPFSPMALETAALAAGQLKHSGPSTAFTFGGSGGGGERASLMQPGREEDNPFSDEPTLEM